MPAGSYLLDTNILLAVFAQDMAVLARLATTQQVYIPSIVLGELYYGAFNSGRVVENVARVDEAARSARVLACDAVTGRHYGQVKLSLRRKGRPIPENDVWIAALALQHGLTLVSRDAHFMHVDGLVLESWRDANDAANGSEGV